MSGVKGPPTRNMRNIGKALAEIPRVAAIEVAREGAPVLSGLAGKTYDQNVNVYGGARERTVEGAIPTLYESGDTRRGLVFESHGTTTMRVKLPTDYAKYLIGKYAILPVGGSRMPGPWLDGLDQVATEEVGDAWDEEKKKVFG